MPNGAWASGRGPTLTQGASAHTCWCFLSISSSSPSTLVCFSFTFNSSSSLAWSSSSWRVTCRSGFTYDETRERITTPPSHGSRGPDAPGSAAHLGEDAPPLPVPQFQVRGAVPLQDLQRAQLLLLLGESPGQQEEGVYVQKNEGPCGTHYWARDGGRANAPLSGGLEVLPTPAQPLSPPRASPQTLP